MRARCVGMQERRRHQETNHHHYKLFGISVSVGRYSTHHHSIRILLIPKLYFIMGFFRVLLLLATTVVLCECDTKQVQQPVRPTRTLGSLFGSSKPTPSNPQQVQVPQQQQQVPDAKVVGNPGVRPLVYQVKYYDRVGAGGVNNIDTDARNYGTIDKSGVVVDPAHNFFYNGQQSSNRVYYYNPLIPQVEQQPVVHHHPVVAPPVYYTVAQVGNSQVLVPCSSPPDQIYDSTVAVNVDQPSVFQQVVQQQKQVPVVKQEVTQATNVNQQRVVVPPATVTQPLVREQVVAAAAEMSALGSVPGSAVVGAGINSVPYGYYYYYYIPNDPVHQRVVPQVQQQQQPQVHHVTPQQLLQQQAYYQQFVSPQYPQQYAQQQQQNFVYRLQNNVPVVPVIVSGVPVINHAAHSHISQQVVPHQQQVYPVRVDGKDKGVVAGQQQQQQQRVVVATKDGH